MIDTTPTFNITVEEYPLERAVAKHFPGSGPVFVLSNIVTSPSVFTSHDAVKTLYFHNVLGITHIKKEATKFASRVIALRHSELFEKTLHAHHNEIIEQVPTELTGDESFYVIQFIDETREVVDPEENTRSVFTRFYSEGYLATDIAAAEMFTSPLDAVQVATILAQASVNMAELELASDAAILKLRLLGQVSTELTKQINETVVVDENEGSAGVLPIVVARRMIIQVAKITLVSETYHRNIFWRDIYAWQHVDFEEQAKQEDLVDDDLDEEF